MNKFEQKIRENLAYNIRVERAKNDITQKELARLVDISAKLIAQIENCKVLPSIYIVCKIANVLKVSVSALLTKETQIDE